MNPTANHRPADPRSTEPPSTDPGRVRNRNRLMLIAIFAIFFGGFALAGLLRFSGWRPAGMKNHGELLQPPTDLRALTPTLAAGGDYRWNPVERRWRIVVAPPAAQITPGASLRSMVHQLSKVVRLGSLVYIFSSSWPGYSSWR